MQDSETALTNDKNNIRAIYQKAEALYFLGQFELSLMFFHRGFRLRPELNNFRLGVQKTQEAIEKTIGGFEKPKPKLMDSVRSKVESANKSKPKSDHYADPRMSSKSTVTTII